MFGRLWKGEPEIQQLFRLHYFIGSLSITTLLLVGLESAFHPLGLM